MKCKTSETKVKFLCIMLVLFVMFGTCVVVNASNNNEHFFSTEGNFVDLVERAGYHGYAGFVTSSTYLGLSANIGLPVNLPKVEDSGESVWVSTSKSNSGEWVQAGARYYYNYTAFKKYVEYFENGNYRILMDFGIHDLGSTETYKVEFSTHDGKWHAYINGEDCASTLFSPSSMSVQANAEIHKSGIQMGPFSFKDVKVKNSNLSWENNTTSPECRMSGYSWSGIPTQFSVWGPE